MSIRNATLGDGAGEQGSPLRPASGELDSPASTPQELESVFASLAYLLDEPAGRSAPVPALATPPAPGAPPARPPRPVPRPRAVPPPLPVAAMAPRLGPPPLPVAPMGPISKLGPLPTAARPIAIPPLRLRAARTQPPPHGPEAPHPPPAAVPAIGTPPARHDETMTLSNAPVAPPPSRRGHLFVGLLLAASACLVAFVPRSSAPPAAEPVSCAPSAVAPAAAPVATPPCSALPCAAEPAPPALPVIDTTAPHPVRRASGAPLRKAVLAPTPIASAPPPPPSENQATAPRNRGRLFGTDD